MAKVTWIGEDESHIREDGSGMGPQFVTFQGQKFEKGKPLDVTDPTLINKAIGSRFFEVELTAAEQERYDEEHMPEPADEAPEPKRRPPGRPPKVKPHVDDQNAA